MSDLNLFKFNKPRTRNATIEVTHTECNRSFKRSLADLENNPTCPICKLDKGGANGVKNLINANSKSRQSGFSSLLVNDRVVSGEYTVNIKPEEYLNNKTAISFIHNTCGNEIEMRVDSFKRGRSCKHCANQKRLGNLGITLLTINEIKDFIESSKKYKLITETYIGNKVKVEILHIKCNRTFHMRYNDFQQGYRCPMCSLESSESIMEKKINKHLLKLGVKFDREVQFKGLYHKRRLRLDFVIYKGNMGKMVWIEYNGKHHYVDFEGFREPLELVQLRDGIKVTFAKKHKIPLLVIPYTHASKYKKIINKFLKKHSVI